MKSSPEAQISRKAFSARKSIEHNDYNFNGKKSILKNTNKFMCASASNLSSRSKLVQQYVNYEHLLSDFSQEYHKMRCINDQKTFLYSSQILEKLNKVMKLLAKAECITHQPNFQFDKNSSSQVQLSLRNIIFYHDVLKRLLEERCSIIIIEECNFCIRQTEKLIVDFKFFYRNEKLKMTTLPVQTFNRFIDCSDISLSLMEHLLKKLQMTSDLYSSLRSSYQKIMNFSLVGFDMELHLNLLKALKIIKNLRSSLFYWAQKNVNIFLQKLCLADPSSISPEFLQNALRICKLFNILRLDDSKQTIFELSRVTDSCFENTINFECEKLPSDLMLHYLSHFEAKVASERIVYFLASECKRHRYSNCKKKSLSEDIDPHTYHGSTSDYGSATVSDVGVDHPALTTNSVVNASTFSDILISLIQRNQALVFKYIYSVTNLNDTVVKNKKKILGIEGEISHCQVLRQTWVVPQVRPQYEGYLVLEEIYWSTFWTKLQNFVLKLLSELPFHQYGDTAAGAVHLWPNSYLFKVIDILRKCSLDEEVPTEGRYAMKQIYNFILTVTAQISWDKNFAVALSAMHLHLCVPVPTVLNGTRTYPGNLFCSCIEVLIKMFQEQIQNVGSLQCLKSILQLQATLDSFILWISTKTRAFISCQNLPAYLLICGSDCKWAESFLKNKILFNSPEDIPEGIKSFSSLRHNLGSLILKQISIFEGYMLEAPHLMHLIIFGIIKKILWCFVKSRYSCRRKFKDNLASLKVPEFESLEHVLCPLNEVINKCNIFNTVSSIVSAISEAFIFVLQKMKKCVRNFQIMNEKFLAFLKWLSELEISESNKERIKSIHYFKKLCNIIRIVDASHSQQSKCFKLSNNRISPLPLPGIYFQENTVLNEEDRIYWLSSNKEVCVCC